MKRILLTGAGGSATKNVVECLRMAHWYEPLYIVGTDVNRYHIMLDDVNSRYIIPSASESGYVQALNRVVKDEGVGFIHPQPDPEVLMVAKSRQLLRVRTCLPSVATIELCQDKLNTNRVLASANVPVAESVGLSDEYGCHWTVKRFTGDGYGDRAWLRARRGAGSKAAVPVFNSREAIGHVRLWSHRGLGYDDFMLSEYLPGADFAWTSVWFKGELITSCIRKRVMYLLGFTSPSGMSSSPSVAVTVHDSRVNKIAYDAVLAVDSKPHGAFYVDLKENKAGVPCVTEINAGRFNATVNYFAHCGVNMPYVLLSLVYGDLYDPVKQFDAADAGFFWVRQIDMGAQLFRAEDFIAKDVR